MSELLEVNRLCASYGATQVLYDVDFSLAAGRITAILGATVDTGVLPPIVHAMIAYGAIFSNLAAVKVEIAAVSASTRIVDEVNRLIQS